MIKQAMILAAGRGQRMMPLTASCPKPLLKVNGCPLIEYHIKALAKKGVERIVINHAWLGYMIEQKLGDGSAYGINIVYSAEREALETAGGIVNALPLLNDEPFWLVNGDVFTDYDFADVLPAGKQAHLVMVNNPQHNPDGDFALVENLLVDDGEAKLTYSGIGIYSPTLFSSISPGVKPLAPILRHAMATRDITGSTWLGHWCDVGTPERLAALNGG